MIAKRVSFDLDNLQALSVAYSVALSANDRASHCKPTGSAFVRLRDPQREVEAVTRDVIGLITLVFQTVS